jgi:hypothetical protein
VILMIVGVVALSIGLFLARRGGADDLPPE